MPPDALIAWEGNPNIGDVAKVAASIERFGFVAPICVWTSRGRMVAGHTRLAGFRSLLGADPAFLPRGAPGPGLVPVRFHEFRDEAEADAYALADNQLERLAQTDDVKLAAALERIRLKDATLPKILGFDEKALEAIRARARLGTHAGEKDPDDVPELPKVARTKPGDLIVLGAHRLICGDCRDPKVVDRLFSDIKISPATIAFTSPPYASQRKYDEASGFKPIAPDDFVAWFEPVQANVRTHLAADGSWFVNIKELATAGERHLYVHDLVVSHRRAWSWLYVDELCWERVGMPGHFAGRFKNGWEPVFHFGVTAARRFYPERVGRASTDIQVSRPESRLAPMGGQSGGLDREEVAARHRMRETRTGIALPTNRLPPYRTEGLAHTAAFPVALPEFFVHAFTDEGDVVFDPFMGSGSTLIACERTNRVGLGVEISPLYCDVIVERWEKLTGRKATRSPEPKGTGNAIKAPARLASPSKGKSRGKQGKRDGEGGRDAGKAPAVARAP